MKRFKICHKCAEGRIDKPFDSLPLLDGKMHMVSTHTSPSKKLRCSECKEKVRYFWIQAKDSWVYKNTEV